MKETTLFIFLILTIGCRSKGSENYNSLLKVKKGMNYDSVNIIMKNKAREVKTAFWNDTLFVQYYDSGFGASDDFKIIFNGKDSIVVDIEYGD